METGKVEPYIAIFKGFDEKKRAMEQRFFKFRSKLVVTKYDPETGESDAIDDYKYGIYVLTEFFEAAASALTGANAHFARYFERFRSNSEYHIIQSIAGKLGVSTQSYGNNNASTPTDFNSWKSSSSSTKQESEPDLSANTIASSASSMKDIAALMSSNSVDELPDLA
jgi:hypothetical protein